jgi:flagellar biosynthesis protein FliP
MELAFLVWGISMLPGLLTVFVVLAFVAFILLVFSIVFIGPSLGGDEKPPVRIPLALAALSLLFTFVSVAIPSKDTAYIMVGAYAAQQIAQNPKLQQVGAKTLRLIEQKLDEQLLKSAPAPTTE